VRDDDDDGFARPITGSRADETPFVTYFFPVGGNIREMNLRDERSSNRLDAEEIAGQSLASCVALREPVNPRDDTS
jgi:hypothetical protein